MNWHLWERFGVEQEFMIVDSRTLNVLPKADLLLRSSTGEILSDIENGEVGWSNELVSHVIELKSAQPLVSLEGWSLRIAEDVKLINQKLSVAGACLLPMAVHPWMNPHRETVIWPHEYNEIYKTYDRIFNCKGHGWANLQSVHLNLSFQGDSEFGALHGAIRAILPLIPGLAASSPYLNGRFCGFLDGRLETYRHNQERIPIIAGEVIPEGVYSQADYERVIFHPIQEAIQVHDSEGVLSKYFLNSRGAIARFDRGAIEIRTIDIQECPDADLAILQMVTGLLKLLAEERWVSMAELQSIETRRLAQVYQRSVEFAESAKVEDLRYLRSFGLANPALTVAEVWKSLWLEIEPFVEPRLRPVAQDMLNRGTLATCLLREFGRTPSHDVLRDSYAHFANCLAGNQLWDGYSS